MTFLKAHNTSEPSQNFIKHSNESRSERGCWDKKPPRAAPHWVHTSEYSENHLVIPTPHNTAQHLIRHHYTHQPVTNMDPEQEVNSVTEYSDTDIITNHQSSRTKRSCAQTVVFKMAMEMYKELGGLGNVYAAWE